MLAVPVVGLACLLGAPSWPGAAVSPRPGSSPASHPLQYVSPLPGSKRVLPETNIIVRPRGTVDPSSLAAGALVTAAGSRSGTHEGRLRLSDDGRTVMFQPFAPFTPGETVRWALAAGLRTDTRGEIPSIEFEFTIAGPEREALREFRLPLEDEERAVDASASAAGAPGASAEPLPADFPHIEARVLGSPSPGCLFLSDFNIRDVFHKSYLMILKDDGTPVFQRKLEGHGLDFKVQPDGRLTYFDTSGHGFYALDSEYALVDSFRCGNGFTTDPHDLIVLPNGHALLMSYDPQFVDMSLIVPGGNPFAIVTGLILQELDREKNVVFQWRSWDHFQITDATHITMTRLFIDYVHGNSLDVDPDGNILVSCRNMDEVTKISRETGEVLWRLGGKNSDFVILDDPIGFSRQHAARQLPNGNITLFDNGSFHDPPFSRAAEYALDLGRGTATLVWSYRHHPDVFAVALGNVHRLSTGNTLISWGATTPTLTEVAPNGRVVSELTFDAPLSTYRAFRFPWPPARAVQVELNPSTINLASMGAWLTALLEPADFDLEAIDRSSIRLDGSVPAEPLSATMGDENANGIPDLRLRFDLQALAPLLTAETTRLEVTGTLTTGELFRGSDAVTVVPESAPNREASLLRLASAPGTAPVILELRGASAGGGATRTASVYDAHGRLLRRWRVLLGGGRVTWDGRGDDGSRVGSGVYFVRVEGLDPSGDAGRPGGSGRAEAIKVVLLR